MGYRNRGLPNGVWQANWALVGNATGGNRRIEIVFKPANVTIPNQSYSLEHVSISDTDNNANNIDLATDGFAFTFGSDWGTAAAMKVGQVTSRLELRDMAAIRGQFLGEPNRTRAAVVQLIVNISNINAATFAGVLAGYIWGPEAKATQGGPQRPGGGVFPA